MTPLSELIRKPKGTLETYFLEPGTESYFLKKLSTYALRARAKVDYDVWVSLRLRDDTVQRMVVVKIIRPGRRIKKRGRKKNG